MDNYRDLLKNNLKSYEVYLLYDLKKKDLSNYKNSAIDNLRNKTGISQVNYLKNIDTSGIQNQSIDHIKGFVNGLGFRNQYHHKNKFKGKGFQLSGSGFHSSGKNLKGEGLFGNLGGLGGNIYGSQYGGPIGGMAASSIGSSIGNSLDKLIGTGIKRKKILENNNNYIPRNGNMPAFYTVRKSLQ